LSNVKKLLSDERRRSNSDSQKISEAQLLFAQVIKDYNGAIENIRQLQQEKRAKVIMNKDYYNGYPIISFKSRQNFKIKIYLFIAARQ